MSAINSLEISGSVSYSDCLSTRRLSATMDGATKILMIKERLFADFGIEESAIWNYLRGVRSYNLGIPLGKEIILPPGKISFEGFDQRHKEYKQFVERTTSDIACEKAKMSLLKAKFQEPILTTLQKDHLNFQLEACRSKIYQWNIELGSADIDAYQFYHKEPIDAAKFYADIAPLINELNELLLSKALDKRRGIDVV